MSIEIKNGIITASVDAGTSDKSGLVDRIITHMLAREQMNLKRDLRNAVTAEAPSVSGELRIPTAVDVVVRAYKLRGEAIRGTVREWMHQQQIGTLAAIYLYSRELEEHIGGLGALLIRIHQETDLQKVQLQVIEEMNDLEPGQGPLAIYLGRKPAKGEGMPQLRLKPRGDA